MAVPRNRLSKSRTGNRRAHHAKKPVNVTNCKNAEGVKLPHALCNSRKLLQWAQDSSEN